jgi:predicted peptidase
MMKSVGPTAKLVSSPIPKWRVNWLVICFLAACVTLIAQFFPEIMRAIRSWPRPGHQAFAGTVLKVGDLSTKVKYLVYLPIDYTPNAQWPLLLFLHGSGQSGDDLELVAKYGPPALIASGKQLPMIAISPQCRTGELWESHRLLALLNHLEQRFSVDPDRVYISGYSIGGYGTWALAAAAPERFAAAVPVSGGGKVEDAKRLASLPIWAFHGDKDDIVPLQRSQEMVDAIRAQGGSAKLTILNGQGHGIEENVFADDKLYDWLFKQRKVSTIEKASTANATSVAQ